MEPWYKNTVPRAEVREGRSFNPDEFAIALEQVAANKGPDDYRDPAKFFSRTCFTRHSVQMCIWLKSKVINYGVITNY